jgi:hypothetical protein
MPWENADLLAVPAEYRGGLNAFILFGRDPLESPLLLAVLCDSLSGFLEHGGISRLNDIALIYAALAEAPAEAWGNSAAVSRWIRAGGLQGMRRGDARLQ